MTESGHIFKHPLSCVRLARLLMLNLMWKLTWLLSRAARIQILLSVHRQKKNIHTTHKKMQTKALYQTFFFLVFFYQDLQEDCKSCWKIKKTKTMKRLEEEEDCDYDFNSLLFVECCVMLGTTQQTTPHHSPHSHYPSCLHALARLVIPI